MAADHLIFGEDDSVGTNSEETGLNNNVVIVGPSGCGKTMSVVIPRMLETADPDSIPEHLGNIIPGQRGQFTIDFKNNKGGE